MSTAVITTSQSRIAAADIPENAAAVSWRSCREEDGTWVWQYRIHLTVRAAKIWYGKYSRAYDANHWDSWGWHLIQDYDRKLGVWL